MESVLERRIRLNAVCGKKSYAIANPFSNRVSLMIRPKKCNSWLCQKCKRILARSWARSVAEFFAGSTIRMVTLTLAGNIKPEDSPKQASEAWNRLRLMLTREYGRFKYVRVLEIQPRSQRVHYHMLVDRFMSHDVLSRFCVLSGFGPVCDIRLIKSQGALEYVKKYLSGEEPDGPGLQACVDSNARRCAGSRGFVLVKYRSGNSINIMRSFLSEDAGSACLELMRLGSENGASCTVARYDPFGIDLEFYLPTPSVSNIPFENSADLIEELKIAVWEIHQENAW